MKSIALLTIASVVQANSVPIMPTMPGWELGTKGAQVEIRAFYDMLCPDSKANHYIWKTLLPKESIIPGKKWSDIIDMKVTPFVLPYHLHSYEISMVIPYLFDMCQYDSNKCYMDKYAEIGWSNWEDILSQKNVSYNTFVKGWAKTVSTSIPDAKE